MCEQVKATKPNEEGQRTVFFLNREWGTAHKIGHVFVFTPNAFAQDCGAFESAHLKMKTLKAHCTDGVQI